jgi:GGDEF domain-containing protein
LAIFNDMATQLAPPQKTRLSDPLTGFPTRRELIADLEVALDPTSSPSVLAVFDLVGWSDYRETFGEQASDQLTARLAHRFASVVHLARSAKPFGNLSLPLGLCYRARQDEFCALINMPLDNVRHMLDDATEALTDEGRAVSVTAECGAVVLPEEAEDAVDALTLASERLTIATDRNRRRDAWQSS